MHLDSAEQLYPVYPEAAVLRDRTDDVPRRLKDLQLLHRLMAKVSSTLEVQEVLDSITQEVCETLGYPGCNILLPDEDGSVLLVQASYGVSPEYSEELNRRRAVPLNSMEGREWPAEFAHRYARTYSVDDALSHATLKPIRDLMERQNIRSILCTPLVHRDRSIGVMTAYSSEPRQHEQREMDLLLSIGRQAGVAIENARLYQNSRSVAVVEERNRLAREIHDTLAQSLTALVMQLDAAELLIGHNPDAARRELQEARSMARESLDQARRSVWALQPTPLLDRSLDEAISEELDRLSDQASITTRWSVIGAGPHLLPDLETQIFRIAQECVSNIRKHSQARRVRGSLVFGEDHLELAFSDNGVGFSPDVVPDQTAESGFGLVSMKERAVMLGGSLTVQSSPGAGTSVHLWLPYATPSSQRSEWSSLPNGKGESQPIRVLIVDDHPLARQGIRRLLDRHSEMLVCAEAADGEEAVQLYEQLRPDLVLMDLHLPVMNGIDALRAIRDIDRDARVIILTAFDTDERLFEALKQGARGYLLKDAGQDELYNAIDAVWRGESLVQSNMTLKLVDRFGKMARHETAAHELTDREREVLRLIFAGKRNKEIAQTLSISEQTIKFHVANIFQKLGVSSRTEAVNVALERGWLSV